MSFIMGSTAHAAKAKHAKPELMKIAVTSPWLYEVASFVGGRLTDVRALSRWSEDGRTIIVGSPTRSELVIAFDPEEAARFRISSKNKNLRVLYSERPMDEASMRAAFFDPAMFPFIAQEVMKILSAEDAENYSYYQRRLAEFQSRIDSAIGVGRHMLEGVGILDLTGAEGTWVRSAINGVVRPPVSVWNSWLAGDSKALRAALDEASRRGWLLLLDPWTPPAIRAAASAYAYRLTLPPPSNNEEYFVFLNEIFTIISRRVNANAASKAKTK